MVSIPNIPKIKMKKEAIRYLKASKRFIEKDEMRFANDLIDDSIRLLEGKQPELILLTRGDGVE